VGAENILVITFDRDHSASEAIGALTGLAADGRVELRRPRSSVGRATAGCRSAMRSAMWRPRGRWPERYPRFATLLLVLAGPLGSCSATPSWR
jgi:hypothetical protein